MKRGRGSVARQISGLENVKVGGRGEVEGEVRILQDGSISCISSREYRKGLRLEVSNI